MAVEFIKEGFGPGPLVPPKGGHAVLVVWAMPDGLDVVTDPKASKELLADVFAAVEDTRKANFPYAG